MGLLMPAMYHTRVVIIAAPVLGLLGDLLCKEHQDYADLGLRDFAVGRHPWSRLADRAAYRA